MIQDLHSHTYYSFCGKDTPEAIVEAAISGGIELFGISDHNYGVMYGEKSIFKSGNEFSFYDCNKVLKRYYDHVSLIKEKYADKIKILSGIEVATLGHGYYALPEVADISIFDYCLVEHIDAEDSITHGDIFSFAKRCGCPMGIAHTDLFAYVEKMGEEPLDFLSRMAKAGIFWEMNVSYDSIHQYREHQYVKEFFADAEKQQIVRKSGLRLSVGFDGHRVEDYLPERVADACKKIEKMGIGLAFVSDGKESVKQ